MFNTITQMIQRMFASRDAERAANLSAETADDLVERNLGPAPSRTSYAFRQLVAGQDAVVRLRERREDLGVAQSHADKAGNPFTRGAWAFVLISVELVSVLLLLRDLDVPASSRLGAASGLLLATLGVTIALTHVLARTATATGMARAGWVVISALTITLFGAIVLSFVLIRLAAAVDDRPVFLLIAEALLLAVGTAAPAFWVENAWREFRAALAAWLELRLVRLDVRRLEGDAGRVERGIREFEEREVKHNRDAARIRADLSIRRRAFEAGRSNQRE